MSKAIRIFFIVVAVACIPALIFPELGVSQSPASPAAILIISGLVAIFWPSAKTKRIKVPVAREQKASQDELEAGPRRSTTESGFSRAYQTEGDMSTTESGFHRKNAA